MKYNKTMRRIIRFSGLIVVLFALFFPVRITPTQRTIITIRRNSSVLCGDGSQSGNYGFSYNLQQPHWTVNGERYVSEDTMNQVDTILDRLNNDSIAQTMILFKSQEEVGNRVNCAVHFLRYMKLGLPEGERKDNGFAFLIVVGDGKIDVHYGVGLGLPALTAPELTGLNRLAEETYSSSHNMDETLLALIKGYDQYTRSKYGPLVTATSTPVNIVLPATPKGSLAVAVSCCLICIGIIVLIIVVIILIRLFRFFGGIPFIGGGSSWGDSSSPWSGPSSGGSGPVMRGGGGSGRSRRGN
jgi:hypothetical protein